MSDRNQRPPQVAKSQQTTAELLAIHVMFVAAAERGLSCEMVWEFGHIMVSNGGLVSRACSEAMRRVLDTELYIPFELVTSPDYEPPKR